MSYEQGALGWSAIPWTSWAWHPCPTGSKCTCVTSDPVDQAWANQRIGSGTRCSQYHPHHAAIFGSSRECTTGSGNPGTTHCCKQLTDSQEAMLRAGVDPYAPVPLTPGGDAAAVICTEQRVPRDAMTNARQRAVWDVKDALCRIGTLAVDPGPVNAEITTRLSSAIRRFQTDSGITPTGRVDNSTLSALGFTFFRGMSVASALKGTSIGPTVIGPVDLAVSLALVGGIGVGGFFLYKRFTRR